MITIEKPSIATMYELLEALYVNRFVNTQKYDARVKYNPPNAPEVVESFANLISNENVFGQKRKAVSLSILNEALREEFISGILKSGIVSSNEFELTERGKVRLKELRQETRTGEIKEETVLCTA